MPGALMHSSQKIFMHLSLLQSRSLCVLTRRFPLHWYLSIVNGERKREQKEGEKEEEMRFKGGGVRSEEEDSEEFSGGEQWRGRV